MRWLLKYGLDDYQAGHLGLAHPLRPELIALGAVALALAAWWFYRREAARLSRPRRVALAALRTCGVALVLAAVLGPVLRLRAPDEQAGGVAIAIDASRSMGLPGTGGKTRLEQARAALAAALPKLEQAGPVRLYAFGDAARPIDGTRLATLEPADDATRLANALKETVQSARGRPLDAIIVLSDGAATDGADAAAMATFASSRGTVVHTVGYGGGADQAPDVGIADIRHPPAAQAGTLAEIAVAVTRRKARGPLTLKLFHGDTFLQDAELPDNGDGRATVPMHFLVDQAAGAYRVEVQAVPAERLLENNKREFRLEVRDARVEVLFVEGSPRHEYAFIRRSMADDQVFKVVTLLRLGHDRWYTAGDPDGSVLANGFPKTAEALGRFKAIILSDIEAAEFSPEQQRLISDFVSVRGGGLLMLGGLNSFNLGGWTGTPVADLLPVRLADAGEFDANEFAFALTKEGTEHEILTLGDPAATAGQWAVMPSLKGRNTLRSAKPGAHVLAERPGSANAPAEVLLAVQDVGSGRVAAFASANSWRWKMLRPADDDGFRRFWSQMIRWLAAGSKELLTVETDAGVADVGQPIGITAQVLDKTHRPANDAKVVAKVKDPFGHVDEIALPWSLSEDGVYRASYRPADVGDYEITAVAALPAGALEPRTIAFSAARSSPEFARPELDAASLERIAKAGGGTVDLDGKLDRAVAAVLDKVASRKGGEGALEERELRDAPALLLAIAACWIAEWLLRRRSGLA